MKLNSQSTQMVKNKIEKKLITKMDKNTKSTKLTHKTFDLVHETQITL